MLSLAKALQRFADRRDLDRLDAARRFERPETVDAHDAVTTAQQAVHESFRRIMAQGRMTSIGRRDGSPTDMISIAPSTWRKARIDWDGGSISYDDGTETVELSSVAVQSWLDLPDTADRLAGLPLSVAFRRFVLEDPQFQREVEIATTCFPGRYACGCHEVLNGWFTDKEPLWPAVLTDYDLIVEWMDVWEKQFAAMSPSQRRGQLDWLAGDNDEDRRAFRTIRGTEAVVRRYFDRFLGPLRSGRLTATGNLVVSGMPATISPAIWLRPAMRIDFVNGELLFAGPDGPPQREWTGVTIVRPEVPQAVPEAPPKGKGGRPQLYPWDEALDRLMVKLVDQGEPDTGAALARMMADCFQEMKASPPADSEIEKWLRGKYPHLWRRVISG